MNNTRTAKSMFIKIYGWYGAIGLLSAYVLLSFGILSPENIWYQLLNITAVFGIVTVSLYKKAYQPGVLNIIWGIVGIIALVSIIF